MFWVCWVFFTLRHHRIVEFFQDPRLRPVHFAPSDQTNSEIIQDAGVVIAKLAKGGVL